MKQIAAILFLGIFLFTVAGYRLVSAIEQENHAVSVIEKLDNKQFNEEDLIEIRVPVSLPYQTDWNDFQRKDGSIEVNGIHYNYVMVKLTGGEMIYKCLPDYDKTQMVNARDNFFKLVNDLQTEKSTTGKHANSSTFKSFNFDYFEQMQDFAILTPNILINFHSLEKNKSLPDTLISPSEQPPDGC